MKKKRAERRAELRERMQREVENNLVSDDELAQLAGALTTADKEGPVVVGRTDELTCECWCATGLLSTCFHGTIDVTSA